MLVPRLTGWEPLISYFGLKKLVFLEQRNKKSGEMNLKISFYLSCGKKICEGIISKMPSLSLVYTLALIYIVWIREFYKNDDNCGLFERHRDYRIICVVYCGIIESGYRVLYVKLRVIFCGLRQFLIRRPALNCRK